MPAFIIPDQWPPNSPGLNPVDYKIWAVIHQRVYQSRAHSVEELKERLLTFGMASNDASLTVQLTNGACVFEL